MKSNSLFLKLHYSLGEIDTNNKKDKRIFWILGSGNLSSAVTLKIWVPKLFFLHEVSDEVFLYEIQ